MARKKVEGAVSAPKKAVKRATKSVKVGSGPVSVKDDLEPKSAKAELSPEPKAKPRAPSKPKPKPPVKKSAEAKVEIRSPVTTEDPDGIATVLESTEVAIETYTPEAEPVLEHSQSSQLSNESFEEELLERLDGPAFDWCTVPAKFEPAPRNGPPVQPEIARFRQSVLAAYRVSALNEAEDETETNSKVSGFAEIVANREKALNAKLTALRQALESSSEASEWADAHETDQPEDRIETGIEDASPLMIESGSPTAEATAAPKSSDLGWLAKKIRRLK